MGSANADKNKNKTISFRVNEDAFETLREIAEERDISLSAVFREYVDTLVAHEGAVQLVPDHEVQKTQSGDDDITDSFPPTVTVPKGFVREHERLELETEHLREQLEEHKQYLNHLQDQLDEEEEIIHLEDLDRPETDGQSFRLE
ncbi:ribbon-helix-helix protein, CopG family [Haloquadratum walsbyi]|jgi:Ribbon-helix-helix protein, copG family.|uniref:CopG family ribbon-helix-helix protein n=1 Tax=Haloquadratum walsbyi J07HQW2 TaxID=1238425 RepID=U1NE72_9EURY|nr:ribbon-helix-helix protein, CopG family [Haloquadratum walsbyi]ERG95305.1 MAG: copG family ribbon-helix-helix protein [Haloquadratum walsbyi J07HQW2]